MRLRFPCRLGLALAVIGCASLLPAPAQASFPGANGKIVFSKDGDLWTIDPDGSDLVQLTSGARADWRPKWAPDGSMIAFNGDDCDPCKGWSPGFDGLGAYVRRANGSITRIGNDHADYTDVAWAPDRRIVFSTEKGAPFIDIPGQFVNVVVANPDGSDRRVITGSLVPAEPDWSPVADQLAILRHYDGSVIYFVDPAGNITYFNDPSSNEIPNSYSPSWSPDGTHLAWVGGSGTTPNNCNGQCVYTAKPDATDFHQVNLDVNSYITSVAWSPDGSQLAFTRQAGFGATPEVWIMDADGENAHFLTEGSGPDWQPLVAPKDLRAPLVGAEPREGRAVSGFEGEWLGTPPVDLVHQWSLCDQAGDNCIELAGATGLSYSPTQDDVGHRLRITVTASNGYGGKSTTSVASKVVGESFVGTPFAEELIGTEGSDLIRAAGGPDTIRLGRGNDVGSGGDGGDWIRGGAGQDVVRGGAGRDVVRGEAGRDVVSGGAGKDVVKGGPGRDRLRAGEGNDRIDARDGHRDIVTCAEGRDVVHADRRDRIAASCEIVRLG